VFRAHKSARKLVALTAEGQRIVRKASGLPEEQSFITGSLNPRSSTTNADLYKVYQKAAERDSREGGKTDAE